MAGIAGALYVPQVGIINPGEFSPAQLHRDRRSGWRSAGAARCSARSSAPSWSTAPRAVFTAALPEIWLFFLGALFVARHAVPAARASSACADAGRPRRERWRRTAGDADGASPDRGPRHDRCSGSWRRPQASTPRHGTDALPGRRHASASTASRPSNGLQPAASTTASCAASSAPTAPARPP